MQFLNRGSQRRAGPRPPVSTGRSPTMKKNSRPPLWIVGMCAVVLLSALFCYWYIFKRSSGTTVATLPETPETVETRTPETEMSTRQSNAAPPLEARGTGSTEEEPHPTETATTDSEAITAAIDFLETLEEQTAPENRANTEEDTGDKTPDLSQDELLQLIQEGVAYYDSLLESGSVDFYLQTATVDFPFEHPEGIKRLPSGTWEGSFEFSRERLRGEVTQNKTQYDAHGSPTFFRDTEQFAYNGETFETYRNLPTGPLLAKGGNPAYDTSIDPRVWGWSLSAEHSLSEILNRYTLQHIETVAGDTGDLFHITGSYADTVQVEFWLNPEKSYRPERYSMSIPTGDGIQMHNFSAYQYQEVAPDLWFPKSAEYILTATHLETGVETDVKRTTVRFSNLRINEPIPPHRFSLEAQPGTTVYDSRTRESFKVE